MNTKQIKIQFKRDTSENWKTNNPTLSSGEMGYDTNLRAFKIGDGINSWNNLPYQPGMIGTGTNAEVFNDYNNNTASGNYSHAEGQGCNAWGQLHMQKVITLLPMLIILILKAVELQQQENVNMCKENIIKKMNIMNMLILLVMDIQMMIKDHNSRMRTLQIGMVMHGIREKLRLVELAMVTLVQKRQLLKMI